MALAESTSLPPLRSVSPAPSSVAPSLPTLSEGAAAAAASFSLPPATQALQRQWKLVKNALLAAAKASASSPAYEPAAASGESPLLAAANPMTARLRREDVSALRAFHRALVNSAPSPAAFGVSVKTIDTLAELLIFRRAFGRPLRVLILAVLCEMWPSFCLAAAAGSDSGLPSVPQFLRVSLRDQTVDPIIDGGLFAALLSSLQEPYHSAFFFTITNQIRLIRESDPAAVPALISMAERALEQDIDDDDESRSPTGPSQRDSLSALQAQLRDAEEAMAKSLTGAPLTVQPASTTGGLFGLFKADPVRAMELDGSPVSELFTILNEFPQQALSHDHVANLFVFAVLPSWLQCVQEPSHPLLLAALRYVQRVIEQAKAAPLNHTPLMQRCDLALSQCVRVLHGICASDPSQVSLAFSLVKAVFKRRAPDALVAPSSGLLLAILQFFVDFSPSFGRDVEALFRVYFEVYLSTHFSDPMIVFDTLQFCVDNKQKLLSETAVFSTYFPQILKLCAWHPALFRPELLQLLPALVGPLTYGELFHALLDLPLVTLALERKVTGCSISSGHSGATPDGGGFEEGSTRVLYNYLLRNESGVNINFWASSTTRPLLNAFCDIQPSARIRSICEVTPLCLSLYFEILISYSNLPTVRDLFPSICERITQLYPLVSYQEAINGVIMHHFVTFFLKWPDLIVLEKDLILQLIKGDSAFPPAPIDMLNALIWLIGELVVPSLLDSSSFSSSLPSSSADYFDALEHLIHKHAHVVHLPFHPSSKLLLIAIFAVAKLSSRFPDQFAPRGVQCLRRLIPDPSSKASRSTVALKAAELVQILQLPHVSATLLGDPLLNSRPDHSFAPESTPLPFLLHSPFQSLAHSATVSSPPTTTNPASAASLSSDLPMSECGRSTFIWSDVHPFSL